ncbi:unnamed protein product [Zymoseptoria tritici ST99CH_1A5]|uniref:Chromatin modification-related protein EAF6 n=3 Tax=Zymoseptoria tritici TaxID=1047171 RepID=F9XCK7_ZYMTI|nr:uncharacterized protein MYCGRDRAFT_43038 [Zymoseptoria tritici IPO323]EGP87194.1 hypothetical protein MYCGRDRAFT_43038 [Zymoseptoria tritici IPO323]SMQ50904.1 unnamed protein product [Zymoseptoria tritici ST99CH_3D7]SMR54178.1 unnamed protein product [Zymoseptoria tritici ST99CH_3D1]SMY24566.1 unnamed protein product [Zymoseptoria tritici ST99CH_1A5]
MGENVPPNSAAQTSAAADQPGRPYYESLRTNLRATLEKKRRLDEQLAMVEEQIHKHEGNYLEETANSGNIVRGFDGWVKGVTISAGGRGAVDDRRRGRVREEDRVFSRSSVGWMRLQEGPESNTPSHAPTPTGSTAPQLSRADTAASTPVASGVKAPGNKKKRPTEKDEEEDSKPSKRGKISYSRE